MHARFTREGYKILVCTYSSEISKSTLLHCQKGVKSVFELRNFLAFFSAFGLVGFSGIGTSSGQEFAILQIFH